MTMTEPRITRMTSAVHPRRIRMRRIRRLPVRMASITIAMGRSITRRIRDVPRSRIMMSSMLSRNAVTEWTMTMTEPRITRMTSAVHPRRIRMRRIRRLPVRMASITIAMGRSITRRIPVVQVSRIMMSSIRSRNAATEWTMTMTEPRITRMTSAVHPRRIRMRRIRRLPVRMASITIAMGRSITRRIRDVPRSRIMMSSMLSRNAVTEWTMTMTEPRITRMTSAVHPRRIRMRRIRRLPVRMASITIAMGRSITRRIPVVQVSRIMMSSMLSRNAVTEWTMTMTEPRITRMTSVVHPQRIMTRRIRRLPVRMASITIAMGRSITRRIRDVPRSRIMMSSMLSRNAVTEWTMTMTEPRITRMTSAVHPRRIRMRRIRRLPVRMASITIAMGRSITRRIRDVPRSRIMMSSMQRP